MAEHQPDMNVLLTLLSEDAESSAELIGSKRRKRRVSDDEQRLSGFYNTLPGAVIFPERISCLTRPFSSPPSSRATKKPGDRMPCEPMIMREISDPSTKRAKTASEVLSIKSLGEPMRQSSVQVSKMGVSQRMQLHTARESIQSISEVQVRVAEALDALEEEQRIMRARLEEKEESLRNAIERLKHMKQKKNEMQYRLEKQSMNKDARIAQLEQELADETAKSQKNQEAKTKLEKLCFLSAIGQGIKRELAD